MSPETVAPIVLNWLLNLCALVLAMAMPALAVALVRWVRAKADQAHAESSGNVRYLLQRAAELGAKAAEQFLGSEEGQAKKSMAVNFVQTFLDAQGVHVDVAHVEAAVEAAVFDEINADKRRGATSVVTAEATVTTQSASGS